MKCKTITTLSFIVAWMGIGLLPTTSLQAQEPGFTETFDNPSLPGWEHSPNATVAAGVLRIESGGYVARGGTWGDLSLAVRVRRTGDGEIAVSYRAANSSAYHVLLGGDFLALQRESDGAVARVKDAAPVSIRSGEWFRLRVTVTGGEHTITLDGKPVLTATDPQPLSPGGIVIEVLKEATGEFDDLTVASGPGVPTPTGTGLPAAGLTWVRTGGPLGGLGYDVRMRPGELDVMYVTDAWAGVFMSTDAGLNWFPSSQGITTRTGGSSDAIPVFSLSIDPNNAEILWAGTQFQRGIFRSTDGARSWAKMDSGVIEQDGITFRGFTIEPGNSNVVYAAAEVSSWAWAGQPRNGREFDMVQGVVYQTTNGGQSWRAIWRGENLARYVWIDPRDTNVIYISTGIFDREAANSDPAARVPGGEGVLKSTDGGQSWANVNNGLGNLYVGTLFMHPEDPDILLAGTGNNQYFEGAGVYLTQNGGQTWVQTLSEDIITSVEFSVSDPNMAYAGSAASIYRSDDGGQTWKRVSGGAEGDGWGPSGIRAGFPIDFQVDPRDADRIFANEYGGGNFLSEDGGQTWAIASAGYTGAQVRAIAVDPLQPGRVYAAGRSGIFLSCDGGGEWIGMNYPPARAMEWNAVAIDPHDPTHILASNNWNGEILVSHDGGESWTRTGTGIEQYRAGWRVIVFAPSDPNIAYAGSAGYYSAGSFDPRMPGRGVYISHDGGESWQPSNHELMENAYVTGLAVDRGDPLRLYAAVREKGILRSLDGGHTWTAINGGFRNLDVLSIAVHPQHPEILLAGFFDVGMYRSTDAGETWQSSGQGLPPEVSASSIVFDPVNGQVVYAASPHSGVYRSEDGGSSWQPLGNGLAMRSVNALAISADGLHLYAATEGGGVYRLDLSGMAPQPAPGPTLAAPTLLPTTAAPPTTQPTAAPSIVPASTPSPSTGSGLPCIGGALPLAMVGLIWLKRRK